MTFRLSFLPFSAMINKIGAERLITTIAAIITACTVAYGFTQIYLIQSRSTLFFNQAPFDGVFQTLFPLRRMDAGEYPGIDFYYFHGNGIPYLLYPVYRFILTLRPGEIYASVMATYLVNTISLYFPLLLLLRYLSGIRMAIIFVLLYSLSVEFFPVFGYFLSPTFIGAPMGMRMLPHLIMAIAAAYFGQRINTNPGNNCVFYGSLIATGVIGAAMPLIAAEQGFYAVAGTAGALIFASSTGDSFWRRLATPIIIILSFIVSLILMLLVLFQSLDTLTAISSIAGNQVWVYGVFPNSFFADFREIFSLSIAGALPSQIMTLVGTACMLIVALFRICNYISTRDIIAVMTLYFGATLSWSANFGYVGQHQAPLYLRECVVAAAILLVPSLQIARRLLSQVAHNRLAVKAEVINERPYP